MKVREGMGGEGIEVRGRVLYEGEGRYGRGWYCMKVRECMGGEGNV